LARTIWLKPCLVSRSTNELENDMSCLPSPADILRDVVDAKRRDPLLFESPHAELIGKRNGGIVESMAEDQSVLMESFLRRLQGRTYWAKFRIYVNCWWHRSKLLRTLQAVENMAHVSLKTCVPGEFSMSEKWRLSKELMRPDHLNFVSNDASVKMYKLFLILYIIECSKHMKLDIKDSPQSTKDISPGQVGHDYLWAVRRITRPPPREVSENEPWAICRKAIYIESEWNLPGDDDCPIHPGWVESSVLRIDSIADDFSNSRANSIFQITSARLSITRSGAKRLSCHRTKISAQECWEFCVTS